jgi:3-oxoacyl-[acyl-carrier protein] reductase
MNKNIFITGGTAGIGKSLINKFSNQNYNIFFTYFKNVKEAKIISENLKMNKVKHKYVKMDLNKTKSIENAFKVFLKDFKKMDIFINNASPNVMRSKFLNLKNKEIENYVKILASGNIITIKKALSLMLKNKSKNIKNIINISSYASISGGKNIHLYAASKSCVNTLITALSKDFFKNKIKIFSIVPKHVNTFSFRKNNNIKNKKDLVLFLKKKKN